MNGGWLKRFRRPKPDLHGKSAVDDWRLLKEPISGKPKTGWLQTARDDKTGSNWRERFGDDEAKREPLPRRPAKPTVKAKPSPDDRSHRGRSRNVRLFEWLMYVSLGVEVATTASDFGKLAELAGGWPVVVLTEVFTLAVFGIFMFVAVYLRKKWALYVIAAFYGFRLLRYIPSFAFIALPLVQFLSAMEFVLQGLALFYAFSGEARAHFAKGKR